MANRNIDENIRKPRRTRGTPFHFQRNLYSLGVILFSGVVWYLYEFWPQTKILKKDIIEGKFKYSPELREHILSVRHSTGDPGLEAAISKLRAKK